MLHYLIDGYNLLYALSEIPPGTLQEKRKALIGLLQKQKPYGRNQATVIFDSREGGGSRFREGDMIILFTSGETADECISAMVRQASNPRTLVVVSNDKGIHTLIRGTGATFMYTKDFLKETPRSHPQAPSPLNPAQVQDITEELKKKWL